MISRRQLRDEHLLVPLLLILWALIHDNRCSGQFAPTDNPLCQNLGAICHARAHEAGLHVSNEEHELYDCTYRLTAVNCTEEYLCTCGHDVSRTQVQALDEYYNEYLSRCRQVQNHNLRTDGGLYCRERLVMSHSTDPVPENSLMGTREDLSLEAAVRGLDDRCPGYLSCHETYVAQQNMAAAGNWTPEVTWSFLCRASRESIACSERVMCGCGLSTPELAATRMAFRDIRHEHESLCNEDLNVGYLHCNGMESNMTSSPPADLARLCEFPASACEERQSKRFSNFTEEDFTERTLYVTCELMKENTACIEDLLCECPGMQLAELVQQFDASRLEYVRNCSDVEDHMVRTEEIRCKDSIVDTGPRVPAQDVIVGEVESDLQLSMSVAQMEEMCPGYTHCLNLSSSYNRRAEKEKTEFDQRVLVCEGSRMNILCLEDVLCACGWSREQVARRTVRQLRHNHETYCDEDLTIGYLSCDVTSSTEQQGQLCADFVNTCERRVVSRYKTLHNNTDHKYVSCETFKTRVQCFEDYVCSCPGQQTLTLNANFDSYRSPYEAQCQDVPTHRMRAGEVYCKDQIHSDPSQVGLELGVEQAAKEISLLDMARQMDRECPGYEQCFNVTATYNLLAAQQNTLAGQLSVSCEGSRYAIICLEDALCACGWGNNTNFRSLLRDLRHQHEVACSQDLTVGYLECGGASVTHLVWLLVLALVSPPIFSCLGRQTWT